MRRGPRSGLNGREGTLCLRDQNQAAFAWLNGNGLIGSEATGILHARNRTGLKG